MLAAGPTATDQIQAFAAIVGALVSSVALLLTYLLLRHEIRTRHAERDEREAAQARLVWAHTWTFDMAVVGGRLAVRHLVRNLSERPVYLVRLSSESRGVDGAWLSGLGPEVIPAGDEAWIELETYDPGPDMAATIAATTESINPPMLTFVDAEGRRWIRYGRSEPTLLYRATSPVALPNTLPGLLSAYLRLPDLRRRLGLLLWGAPVLRLKRVLLRRLEQRAAGTEATATPDADERPT